MARPADSPVTRSVDLLVVGGGIAGLSTALAAAERQVRVLVVNETRPGAASRAAAGILGPSLEGLPPSVHAIAIEARDAYPDFLAGLLDRTGIVVALDRNGILEPVASARDLDVRVARVGDAAQPLDARDLAKLEPALAGHAGALLHPNDGAVDNVALMRALNLAVASDPRVHLLSDRVASLDFGAARPVVSTAAGERIECANVLLAAGAWATDIPGFPRTLPVRPVRGELLLLDHCPIHHVTSIAGGYFVPRGNALIIGATSEESGFANYTTDGGRTSLLALARRAIPALDDSRVTDHWAGLRPVSPDGLPILGTDPEVATLVYACGFSRNGILLAPWSASRLALLMSGGLPSDLLVPFSPARFDVAQ